MATLDFSKTNDFIEYDTHNVQDGSLDHAHLPLSEEKEKIEGDPEESAGFYSEADQSFDEEMIEEFEEMSTVQEELHSSEENDDLEVPGERDDKSVTHGVLEGDAVQAVANPVGINSVRSSESSNPTTSSRLPSIPTTSFAVVTTKPSPQDSTTPSTTAVPMSQLHSSVFKSHNGTSRSDDINSTSAPATFPNVTIVFEPCETKVTPAEGGILENRLVGGTVNFVGLSSCFKPREVPPPGAVASFSTTTPTISRQTSKETPITASSQSPFGYPHAHHVLTTDSAVSMIDNGNTGCAQPESALSVVTAAKTQPHTNYGNVGDYAIPVKQKATEQDDLYEAPLQRFVVFQKGNTPSQSSQPPRSGEWETLEQRRVLSRFERVVPLGRLNG